MLLVWSNPVLLPAVKGNSQLNKVIINRHVSILIHAYYVENSGIFPVCGQV